MMNTIDLLKGYLLLALLLPIGWISTQAQSLTPVVLNATGGSFVIETSRISVCQSVGEMSAIDTYDNGSHVLTQGFLQTDCVLVSSSNGIEAFSSFKLYPNPMKEQLYLQIDPPQQVTLQFYDVQGRLIMEKAFEQSPIYVAHLPSGLYTLILRNHTSQILSSVKLIKY